MCESVYGRGFLIVVFTMLVIVYLWTKCFENKGDFVQKCCYCTH
jgi:hypothetical protein